MEFRGRGGGFDFNAWAAAGQQPVAQALAPPSRAPEVATPTEIIPHTEQGADGPPPPPGFMPPTLIPLNDMDPNMMGPQAPSTGAVGKKRIQEGDWECTAPGCANVNFAKRTRCNKCNAPKPKTGDPLQDAAHSGGPAGLFKKGDWPCTHCGNVNWARRENCNMCHSPKPKSNEEPRMGKGGGHFDIQDPEDRNDHDSGDEVYDEFGRKKRKKKPRDVAGGAAQRAGDGAAAAGGAGESAKVYETHKLVFPPAPPMRKKERRPVSSSSGSESSGSESDEPTSRPNDRNDRNSHVPKLQGKKRDHGTMENQRGSVAAR